MNAIKKSKILPVIIICILGISIVLLAQQTELKKEIKKGLVTYTSGRVKKKTLTSADWENAKKDTSINTGDRVRTYQRSRAEMELLL